MTAGGHRRLSSVLSYPPDVSDLIDTTEMYLRTIYELEEEGVVPLRARIAERLHQSGPTVSQTVARMARDGLVTVEGDRHLELTPQGQRLADSAARRPQDAQEQAVPVISSGLNNRPHVGRRQPFRRLPALVFRRGDCNNTISPDGTAGRDSPVGGIGGSFVFTP